MLAFLQPSRTQAAPGDVAADATGVTLETAAGLTRVKIVTERVTFLDAGSATVLAGSASGTSFQATIVGIPGMASYGKWYDPPIPSQSTLPPDAFCG